ncbi:MAG: YbgC/FadM family acyl-CoA thioesterase [Gammaproteobacteria bacterium]|nr:YbgC/FadM family acyl-CoA thioesterase [Gammaproteobacteria bacterium]
MTHTVQYRVYIEDTDMMRVVYHSNYLNFFERARTEWLRNHGMTLTDLAKNDTNFAVRHLEIEYKIPLVLDDLITIKTQVKLMGFSQIQFIQTMFNQLGIIVSTAVVNAVCVNQNMRPRRLPPEVAKELKA